MLGSTRKGTYKGVTHILALVAALAVFVSGAFGAFGVAGLSQANAQSNQFGIGTPVATIVQVSLMDQPAATSNAIATLPVNTRGIVQGGPFNDGWYWVAANNTMGYLPGSALVAVDTNYTPVPLVTPSNTPAPVQPTDTPVPPQPTNTLAATAAAPPSNTPVPAKPTNTTVPPKATNTPARAVTPVATAVKSPVAITPSPVVTTTLDPNVPTVAGVEANLWLAELGTGGNVRVGPGMDQKVMKSWGAGRRIILYQQSVDSKGNLWYRVSDPPEDPQWVHSSLVKKLRPIQYVTSSKYAGKWVDVSIADQVTIAYQGTTPVKVTLCSTGKSPNDTNIGVWKIYWRLTTQEMKGGSKAAGDYYDLPNVQWVQYFNVTGEALHGTYWHDDFGHPHSHGCVNLSTPIAQWFYGWAAVGTIVNVHN